jgi:hypothetical protein
VAGSDHLGRHRHRDGAIRSAHEAIIVREWLTAFDKLPLFSAAALEPNAEYYLRVRAHTTPRNAAFVWPWGSDIAGLAKFTFLK